MSERKQFYLRAARRISSTTCALAIGIGALVLVGWLLDLPVLKSAVPGLVSMKANSAVTLLLLGGGCWLLQSASAGRRWLATALAAIAGAIGALTLAEYASGLSFGIDELLFRDDPNPVGTSHPGRTSPLAALCIVLQSGAVLVLPHSARWGQRLSLGTLLLSLLVLAGYMYDVPHLKGIAAYSEMAIHSAFAFLLLGIGGLAARPDEGLVSILVEDSVGGLMARRLLPMLAAVVFALGWIIAFGNSLDLYGRRFGLSIFLVLSIVTAALVIWGNAHSLHHIDLRRKRAERENRDQREWLEITLGSIADAVIATDTAGNILFLNAVAEQLTGCSRTDAIGRPFPEVYCPVDEVTGEPCSIPVEDALAGGLAHRTRDRSVLTARNGTRRLINESAAPIVHQDGTVIGAVLVFRDVTQQQKLERERAKLAALVNSSEDAILTYDFEGVVTYWNSAAEGLYGFTAAEMVGCRLTETIVPEHRSQEVAGILARIRQGEIVEDIETERLRSDGSLLDVYLRVSPVRDADGTLLGASAIHRDVTFRRQMERRRNLRLTVTQALNDSAPPEVAIGEVLRAVCRTMEWDLGCHWQRPSNDSGFLCEQIAGRSERDLTGLRGLVMEYCRTRSSSMLEQAVALEQPEWISEAGQQDADQDPLFAFARDNELELVITVPVRGGRSTMRTVSNRALSDADKDGSAPLAPVMAFQFFGRESQAKDEEVLEILSSLTDQVADFVRRREAEAELRRSERNLADFFENAAVGLHLVGPDGIILRANRAELEMLGYAPDEYIGHHIREFHADQRIIGSILDRLSEGEVLNNIETQLVTKDGSIRHVLIDTNALWEDGRLIHTRCFTRDVTERVAAEAALRNREQQFRLLMEQAADAIFIANLEGHFLEVNDSACALFGYSYEALLEKRITDLIRPEERAQLEEARIGLMRGEIQRTEWSLQHADGHYVPVEISARMLPQGRWQAICRDVSERKEAEKAIRDSERLYRAVGESIDYGVWVCEPDGQNVYLSDSFLELVGKSQEECSGTGWAETLHPDDRQRTLEAWQHCVRSAGIWDTEFRIRGADGEYYPILARGVPVRDETGRIIFWAGINLNIARMKHVENELRESQEMFRLVSNSIPQLAWMAKPDGHIFWYNQRWYDFTGTTQEEMLGWGWQTVQDPAEFPRVLKKWKAALSAGSPWEDVFPIRRYDGVMRWHLSRAMPLKDGQGQVVRWFGTNTDITERKQTEAMLQFLADASESLAVLVDVPSTLKKVAKLAVPSFADWSAVDLIDENRQFVRLAIEHNDPSKVSVANEIGARYPVSRNDATGVGKTARTGEPELCSKLEDRVLRSVARDNEHYERIASLGLKSFLCVPLSAHGRTLAVLSFAMAESGRQFGNEDLKVALDLANRAAVAIENARLYQEVRDADRAKDEFLAMLAHELRNPLAPIHSGLEVLALEPGKHRDTVAIMQQQVAHLVRLVDDLLDVSRIMRGRIELRKESISLQSVVAQAVATLETTIRSRSQTLEIDLPSEPLWLFADRVRIAQVLENLLTNASKYTDEGGEIRLSGVQRGEEVSILVEDNGVGIDPALLPKVFDLFAQSSRTLDRSQGGLGIGLTLVRTLVEMHDGEVRVSSDGVGQGSQFEVVLPIADSPPQTDSLDNQLGPSRPCRILIVDDNRGAAKMLARLLEKLDHHTIETVFDGPSALEAAREFQPEIILLDIGLPGMDGFQVARTLRSDARFDHVLIAALTGYGQEDDRRKSKEAGFDEHLVKPPSSDTLNELVRHPKVAGNGRRSPLRISGLTQLPATALSHRNLAPKPASLTASDDDDPNRSANHSTDSSDVTPSPLTAYLQEVTHDLANVTHAVSLTARVLEQNHTIEEGKSTSRTLDELAKSLAETVSKLKLLRDQAE